MGTPHLVFLLKVLSGIVSTAMFLCGFIGIAKSTGGSFKVDEFYLTFNALFFSIVIAVAEFMEFPFFFQKLGFAKGYTGRGFLSILLGSFGVACGQNHTYLLIVGILTCIYGLAILILGMTILQDERKGIESDLLSTTYSRKAVYTTAVADQDNKEENQTIQPKNQEENKEDQQNKDEKETTTTTSSTSSDSDSDSKN
ncbi:golgi apparatus membrane protein tvp15 [Anaeramoeba ignava]|uniref:Golgi apparatus membrane protein tvp15 n=1 Tax=Anaeramoeba ignava TaxID=1746090 RepID=A0A9Q0LTQ7_ANAIG|nr:golgi apparatus membrane protein tvp15 [Anaeramoeba ignava]|eukprot:Anaeramoba_ignava/a359737_28.p1 GENE.a359737_28~~a359737_28.p1  ORF type:complete len:198 (-),score=72.69 a359737_28:14-607(-)